jgi:hypothetical protein
MSDLALCYVALSRGLRDEVVLRQQQELEQCKATCARQQEQLGYLQSALDQQRSYACVQGELLWVHPADLIRVAPGPHVLCLRSRDVVLYDTEDQVVFRCWYEDVDQFGANAETFQCVLRGLPPATICLETNSARVLYRTLLKRLHALAALIHSE